MVRLEEIFVDTVNKELIIAFEYAEYDLLVRNRRFTIRPLVFEPFWLSSRSISGLLTAFLSFALLHTLMMQEIIKAHHATSILTDGMVRSLLWQILNGINYLHSNWIIHRDLKPCNVLVIGAAANKDAGMVKIADLGLARIYQAPLKPLSENGVVVTIWYRAPEILLGAKHYTKAIDMWAVGCIFAELMIRTALFPGAEKKASSSELQLNQLQKIAGWAGKLTPEIWPDCVKLPHWNAIQNMTPDDTATYAKHRQTILTHYGDDALDLLNAMLNYHPLDRITAKDALQHKYFTQASAKKPAMNVFYYQPNWETLYPTRGGKR